MPRKTPTAEKILKAIAQVEVRAAARRGNKPTRVSILAYNGHVIEPPGFGPTVIDLSTLELPAEIPLLLDHENRLAAIAGKGAPKIVRNTLVVAGTLTLSTDGGRLVNDLVGDGMKISASVGIRIKSSDRVRPGETVAVNGRRFTAGPQGLLVVRRGRLVEISFVGIGADDEADVQIAAIATPLAPEKPVMARRKKPTPQTLAATANFDDADDTESERLDTIAAICSAASDKIEASALADIEARAIDRGWNAHRTELEILRAARPVAPRIGSAASGFGQPAAANVLGASLAIAAGIRPAFLAANGFSQTEIHEAERAPNRGASLHSIMHAICSAAGMPASNFRSNDGVAAAFKASQRLEAASGGGPGFSTVSLTGILGNVANKALLEAYSSVPAVWPQIAATRSNSDFKTHSRFRMTQTGTMTKVGADGELKHVGLSDESYNSQLDTFGGIIGLTRQMIVNDDLQAFLQIPRLFGRNSALAIEEAIFALLLANPGNFFHNDNGNLLSGADSALSITSLSAAELKMAKQTDADGKPILVLPRVLLTPPELANIAAQLVRSTETRDYENSDPHPISNPHAGKFVPVSSPWLSSSAVAGSSQTAWYLFADPANVAAIAACFLGGNTTPTIESGDMNFNQLGMQWRCYYDFATGLEDHRAAAKSAGA